MLNIEIHEESLETREKRDKKGTYALQTAYVHLTDRSGKPDRYPQKIKVFPPRDNGGLPVAYPKGDYVLSPSSFRVAPNGFLEIGFVNLERSKDK